MDPVAISTYLTGSTLFLYIALLPDLGVLEIEQQVGKMLLYLLALGWKGNPRQWQMQTIGGIFFQL